MKVLVAQFYLHFCDPVDSSLQGSSVHGVLQARVLEWVVMLFSRGSSRPRDQTGVSGRFLTNEPWLDCLTFSAVATFKAPDTFYLTAFHKGSVPALPATAPECQSRHSHHLNVCKWWQGRQWEGEAPAQWRETLDWIVQDWTAARGTGVTHI